MAGGFKVVEAWPCQSGAAAHHGAAGTLEWCDSLQSQHGATGGPRSNAFPNLGRQPRAPRQSARHCHGGGLGN
eukprot:9437899-Lingulodinium_polyedra.AAC.1